MRINAVAFICEGDEPPKNEPLVLELPLIVIFHGKTYRLQSTKGPRHGLILTRHPEEIQPSPRPA